MSGREARIPIEMRLAQQTQRGALTDCWRWLGRCDAFGYGRLKWQSPNGFLNRAHRVAWVLANGAIPPGLSVLHRCDNPPCVNPNHLFLGTQQDNNADRHNKGRSRGGLPIGHSFAPKGEQHPKAKLSWLIVDEIRKLNSAHFGQRGFGRTALAKRFGVAKNAVAGIVTGRTWRR